MSPAVDERPFPPGDYPVVVVGSGPGGLQASYCLSRLGVAHAVSSRDDAPGGMFRLYPIFQRLLSWSKPDAPAKPGTREYEWYDHNSLLAQEPEHQALDALLVQKSFIGQRQVEPPRSGRQGGQTSLRLAAVLHGLPPERGRDGDVVVE